MDDDVLRKRRRLLNSQEQSDNMAKFSPDELHQSFVNTWPANNRKTAEELVEAGFFYTGQEDEVQCHQCHLKKKNWQVYDVAWFVHAKLRPSCKFVFNTKGAKFPHEALQSTFDLKKYRTTLLHNRQKNDRFLYQPVKKYSIEENRLASYKNWPIPDVYQPEELSKLGFYYKGEGDYIKCFNCKTVHYNWLETEGDPASEHARFSPNCPFIRQAKGDAFIEEVRSKWRKRYENEDARMKSFEKWPAVSNKASNDLAKAGFFHTGAEDQEQTQCFECGVIVSDWNIYDDPWFVHTAVSPNCGFVRRIKGETFVDLVEQVLLTKKKKLLKKRSNAAVAVSSDDSFQSINNEHDDKIQNLMNSITIQTILKLGFNELCIKNNLRNRLIKGETFETPEQIFPALVESQQQDPIMFDVLQDLGKVNKRLQELKICEICERQGPLVIFIPCGHLHSCCSCIKDLKKCMGCNEEPQTKLNFFAK